jgi:hypothetical protein
MWQCYQSLPMAYKMSSYNSNANSIAITPTKSELHSLNERMGWNLSQNGRTRKINVCTSTAHIKC